MIKSQIFQLESGVLEAATRTKFSQGQSKLDISSCTLNTRAKHTTLLAICRTVRICNTLYKILSLAGAWREQDTRAKQSSGYLSNLEDCAELWFRRLVTIMALVSKTSPLQVNLDPTQVLARTIHVVLGPSFLSRNSLRLQRDRSFMCEYWQVSTQLSHRCNLLHCRHSRTLKKRGDTGTSFSV
jgi:hypothetical protein